MTRTGTEIFFRSSVKPVWENAPMLQAARAAAAAEGMAVEWWEASAAKLPIADAAFDVAFCQQGLQFFPDRVTALREMYRVLRPGGGCCSAYEVQ